MLLVLFAGAACNTATNQSNTNTGSNTAGQTAGGGIGTGATGGTNTANQGISQQIMLQLRNNVLQEFLQAQHATLLQTNPIQIQEATLLVKQLVVELELVNRWTNTANQGISQSNSATTAHNVLQELLQAQHVTLLQTKAIQIQEATLLVKQPVAEQVHKQFFYFLINNKKIFFVKIKLMFIF